MNPRGFLLFDIDGVIRNVTDSYRLAIKETVKHFCKLRPSTEEIDKLKSSGYWNNDWDASSELIKRTIKEKNLQIQSPRRIDVIKVFSNFYFGGDPNGDRNKWEGFIRNEKLLVNREFFKKLTTHGFKWGFVSGAEPSSAQYVLEDRLGLKSPPLIAMGDAPDKPNPTGLIRLASRLAGKSLGYNVAPIMFLGDSIADVLTIKKAREEIPEQSFISIGVAPPHLHEKNKKEERLKYEKSLREAGADDILGSTLDLSNKISTW